MHARSSLAIAVLLLALAPSAFGHGGGLDRNGCHTNRKTGEYHCHPGRSGTPAPTTSTPRSAAPKTQLVSAGAVTQAGATTPQRDLVRAAQLLLKALGYTPSLLGAVDARTQAAIRAYQRARSLEPDGAVSEYLVLRLAEDLAAKCR